MIGQPEEQRRGGTTGGAEIGETWASFERGTDRRGTLPVERIDVVNEHLSYRRDDSYLIAPAAAFERADTFRRAADAANRPRGKNQWYGLRRTRTVQTKSKVTHTTFRQTFDGAQVEGAEFVIHHARAANAPPTVSGTPLQLDAAQPPGVPRKRIDPAPDRERLAAAITDEFHVSPIIHDVRLMLLPVDAALVWTYRVRFTVRPLVSDVEVFLDAASGEVLLSYNIAAARHGDGLVYPVSPSRTPTMVRVDFDDLVDPDNGFLMSAGVDVHPGEQPRLRRAKGDYQLDATTVGFDEVQAFHHVSTAVAYFGRHVKDLAGKKPFNPVIAVANDPNSIGNSYWEPDTNSLLFGDFDDRPSARSADMVFHEVGHAVSDRICGLQRGPRNTEARGLSEGYSDYFACSALDDPRFGDYVMGEPDGARNCSKPGLRFAANFEGEEHRTGEVWANALWDCRTRMGTEHMDAIALESITYLSSRSTFLDARAALVSGDAALHTDPKAGAVRAQHQKELTDAFDVRRP